MLYFIYSQTSKRYPQNEMLTIIESIWKWYFITCEYKATYLYLEALYYIDADFQSHVHKILVIFSWKFSPILLSIQVLNVLYLWSIIFLVGPHMLNKIKLKRVGIFSAHLRNVTNPLLWMLHMFVSIIQSKCALIYFLTSFSFWIYITFPYTPKRFFYFQSLWIHLALLLVFCCIWKFVSKRAQWNSVSLWVNTKYSK